MDNQHQKDIQMLHQPVALDHFKVFIILVVQLQQVIKQYHQNANELLTSFVYVFAVDSTSDFLNISQMSTATQKRIKVRPALIADDESNNDEEDEVEVIHEKPRKKDEQQSKTAEIEDQTNREHLETKKQIEDLRREYGDSWLHSKSASKVQNVMGIQHVPLSRSSVFVSSQSPQTTEQMLENLFGLERVQRMLIQEHQHQCTIKSKQE